jgi:hypothetical protein
VRRWVFIGLSMLLILVSHSSQAAPLPPLREVNAPYFSDGLHFDETAVFWLGHVTPNDNYADVRVGYINSALWVHVNIMDEHLWYDTSPSAATLTNWDSVTVYLDKRGNIGSAPTSDSYRLDGQLNWWEPRDNWQTAYRGNGTSWVSIPITFTTYNNWNGDVPPNVAGSHQGWFIAFSIPFSSLGLSGPPPQGTVWGLGIKVHDRDTATGPMQPDESWPDTMLADQPSSWGRLRFGLPSYTLPTPVITQGTTIVRQGLNGAVVQDAVVGGNTLCGGTLSDYFVQWGNLNYAHSVVLNVQNVEATSEWPCLSKVYITFPLDSLPTAKSIISATLTLYHRGNPGPPPGPAYIQVLSVDQSWDENTITWNNAPLARENLGGTWIPPVSDTPPYPGIPYNWDVSRAVAEAYAAGEPLRLAVYSSNSSFSNGRYFHSSDVEDLNAAGRPTLTVVWGDPVAQIHKMAWPNEAAMGQQVTYTLSFVASGQALTLTDDLPTSVSAPGAINVIGGGNASYGAGARRVTWTGAPSSGQAVMVTFPVTVLVSSPAAISNRAVLTDALTGASSDTALVVANAIQVWLPLIMK